MMKQLFTWLIEVVELFTSLGIVHGDIKPDNILVSYSSGQLSGIKVIDFGSCFLFDEVKQVDMSTPEYVPPEVLSHLAV